MKNNGNEKSCPKCRTIKCNNEFYRYQNGRLSSYCKSCIKLRAAEKPQPRLSEEQINDLLNEKYQNGKKCPKCKEIKPSSEFYTNKTQGLSGYCKPCNRLLTVARMAEERVNPRLSREQEIARTNEKYRDGKKCSKCGEVKAIAEFARIKSGRLDCHCKGCILKKNAVNELKRKYKSRGLTALDEEIARIQNLLSRYQNVREWLITTRQAQITDSQVTALNPRKIK